MDGLNTSFDAWRRLSQEQRREIIHRCLQGDAAAYETLLDLIRAEPGYGLYASAGPNYQFAIFGRDSLEVAEDLLEVRPDLAREVILLSAHLQGHDRHEQSEEEPGKIHHEYRALSFNDRHISDVAREVFYRLAPGWGGACDTLCYYGTVDATPLFVRLVGRYVEVYGDQILDEVIIDRFGRELSLRSHTSRAVQWIAQRVESSPWKLLEFKRLNDRGLPYQAWKDSETGYLHLDGVAAWADGGIASIEVQGYVYDALKVAHVLKLGVDESENSYYRALAEVVQQQTCGLMWMEDEKYFAMGLDRSPDDPAATRQIRTLTSNAAALLDSELLLDLDEPTRARYTQPIVSTIMGAQFLTDAGVRLRSVSHPDATAQADYHGNRITWPKETYDIAKGLRRHGYVLEADQLEERIVSSSIKAAELYEFYLVNIDGEVKYHYHDQYPDEPHIHEFGGAYWPEPGQAWTISALLGIAENRRRDRHNRIHAPHVTR